MTVLAREASRTCTVMPLRRGAIYRVYLLPRSGLLLGVEARYDKA